MLTPEEAADAWLRELETVAPTADHALLLWAAEQLAGDTEPDALEILAADLVAIAGVVREEAMCNATT
jgi:hypothetical protein